MNFVLGAGKRLTIEDLIAVSQPLVDCLTIDEGSLHRIEEIWKVSEDAKHRAQPIVEDPADMISDPSLSLAPAIVRAGLVCRIMSLLSGKTAVRRSTLQALVGLVNHNLTPLLSSTSSGAKELISFLAGSGYASKGADLLSAADALRSIGTEPFHLMKAERNALLAYPFLTIGMACLVVGGVQQVVKVADPLACLTAEALGANLEAFDPSLFEACRQHRGQMASATNLKALFEGSKRVVAAFTGDARYACVASIPQTTGPALEVLAAAYKSLDIELNSSEVVGMSLESGLLTSDAPARVSLTNTSAVIEQLIQASRQRAALLKDVSGLSVDFKSTASTQPAAYAQALELIEVLSLEGILALQALQKLEEASDKEKVETKAKPEKADKPDGKPAADDSHLTPEQRAKAEAKRREKAEKAAEKAAAKQQRKASSVVLGGGSASVRALLVNALGELTVPRLMTKLCPVALSTSSEKNILDDLQALLDALHAGGKRKPKIAKGARDFTPEQMRIREQAFSTIRSIFKRHGGVEIDTPVFELKEVLMGKYGEDSKLIYDLADQGGELLSLRYDLTVPFARFLSMNSYGNIKRYHMAKVYRRDNPQLNKGRYREFYQCDFDIAGAYNTMVPDAEVITIATEILGALPIGQFLIKLNHRKLLDAVFEIAGVPASQFRAICSSVDKLDKATWEEVKHEMVNEKHLAEDIADKIGTFVLFNGPPMRLWEELTSLGIFSGHTRASEAMVELKLLFNYLSAMGSLQYISFDLSLARGLDYYTGVIYEAVLVSNKDDANPIQMGSIAAGGRYDQLVGMFSPSNTQTPCVGISIGVERVFTIMEKRAEQMSIMQASHVQVYIASIGDDLMTERMKIARLLWQDNISAEYSHLDNPNFKKQLQEALGRYIPYMVVFGTDELDQGVVKIKDMRANEEVQVSRDEMVAELARRGCKIVSPGDDSFIQAMKQLDLTAV